MYFWKNWNRSRREANVSGYRRVGYLEQCYYIIEWWWKNRRQKRQKGAKK